MPNFTQKPLFAALTVVSIILLITVFLPFYFKTWFVHETGNIRILPAIGPILALGLLLRWRVRKLLLGFFAIGFCFSLSGFFFSDPSFYAGYALLVVLHVFLLWILMSDGLKAYLDGGEVEEPGQVSADGYTSS